MRRTSKAGESCTIIRRQRAVTGLQSRPTSYPNGNDTPNPKQLAALENEVEQRSAVFKRSWVFLIWY